MDLHALTFLHVVAASVWTGGLIALPVLMMRPAPRLVTHPGAPLRTLRSIRPLYLYLLCPAAVLTLSTGLALDPAASTGTATALGLKLWLVAGLALMHLLVARRIVAHLVPSPAPDRPFLHASAAVTSGLGVAILVLGLAGRDASGPNCPPSVVLGPLVQSSLSALSCVRTTRP